MEDSSSLHSLRFWFVTAVVVGTLGIVAGWALSVVPTLSLVLTVAVPLAAMAGYLAMGWAVDRTNLVTLQFADSFYYLGFLFTLVSLSVSLLAFTDSALTDVGGVVSRFGIALLTTVVGLAGRIYLVNFRRPLDDSLAQSEAALAEAGEALRKNLDQLSRDMVIQSKLMNDALRGAIDLTAAELKAAAETGKATIAASSEAVSQAVSTAASEVEASARESGQSVRDSMGALAESVRSTRLPEDLFTAALSPSIEGLASKLQEYTGVVEDLGMDHKRVASAASDLGDAVERLREAGQALSSTLGDVGKEADRLASFGQALRGVAEALQQVQSGLSDHQEVVGRLRTEAERDSEALASHRAQMRENLAASQQALEQVRSDLIGAAQYVRKEISGSRSR